MDHFEVVHCTISGLEDILVWVTDNFHKGRTDRNPGKESFRFIQTLSEHARRKGTFAVCGAPCNTYHSPAMFDKLAEMTDGLNAKLSRDHTDSGPAPGTVKIIHMVNMTGKSLIQKGFKKIGILCSSGTRNFRIYRNPFERNGISLLEVDGPGQDQVDDCIVNTKDGIIVTSVGSKRVVQLLSSKVLELKERGAEVVILGCTELPIALDMPELHGIPLVDPMDILARTMIYAASPERLKPEDATDRRRVSFQKVSISFATKE